MYILYILCLHICVRYKVPITEDGGGDDNERRVHNDDPNVIIIGTQGLLIALEI